MSTYKIYEYINIFEGAMLQNHKAYSVFNGTMEAILFVILFY